MEEKKTEFLKRKVSEGLEKVKGWYRENKKTIVVWGPVIISGCIEVYKMSVKKSNIKEERRLKECYVYDRRYDHYCETKRKIKSSEWVEIDHRRSVEGLPVSVILNDMGLLKK